MHTPQTEQDEFVARLRKFVADPIALPPDPIDEQYLSPEEIERDGGPTRATQETHAARRLNGWHLMRTKLGRRAVVPGRLWRAWKKARTPLYAEAA